MKNIYYLYIVLLAVLSSCSDDRNGSFAIYDEKPLGIYLEEHPEEFSSWVTLLKNANLYNAMNLSTRYTGFVPNNEAMDRYLEKIGKQDIQSLSIDEATALIKYHTIPGKAVSQSDFDSGVIPDTTASGDFLSIEIREGGINSIYVNSESRISRLNLKVTNGYIHVLEDVLTPITETLFDKMKGGKFTILHEAIMLTGYAESLNDLSKRFTLFSVTDEVFRKNGIHDFAGLLAYLGAESDYLSNQNALNKYVAYRILPTQRTYKDLNFDPAVSSKSTNISPLAIDELINVSEVNNHIYLNYNSITKEGIELIEVNINCKNGIMHEVNGLLEVIVPKASLINWEFTDFQQIASAYSNVYRQGSLSATSSNWLTDGQITSWNWQSIPEERMSQSVSYYVTNKNDSERRKSLNYDYMVIRLGYYGWIQMQTPTLIAGKYDVTLYYYSPMAAEATSGKVSFIIDGNYVGGQIATYGRNSKSDTYTNVKLGTIEFSKTTAHTLRILCGDDNTVYLDYIRFTPVN